MAQTGVLPPTGQIDPFRMMCLHLDWSVTPEVCVWWRTWINPSVMSADYRTPYCHVSHLHVFSSGYAPVAAEPIKDESPRRLAATSKVIHNLMSTCHTHSKLNKTSHSKFSLQHKNKGKADTFLFFFLLLKTVTSNGHKLTMIFKSSHYCVFGARC